MGFQALSPQPIRCLNQRKMKKRPVVGQDLSRPRLPPQGSCFYGSANKAYLWARRGELGVRGSYPGSCPLLH